MAWIESHQGLAKHIKTIKLSRKLNVSMATTIGHLHLFWWWSLDNAPDGDLSECDPEIIAIAADWQGDAALLFNSLVETGFIDYEDGIYRIHDWYEYTGRLIEKREQDRERKRRSRGRHADVTRTNEGSHADVQRNRTIPNHTEPNINLVGGVVEEPILDEKFAKVYRTFEQEGFGTISPLLKDTLDHLVNDYTAEWTIRAMHEAAKQGIRKMSYVEGILKRWKAEGVDEPWKQEKVTPFPKRFSRSSTKPHIPVVEQRTGGKALSDDELAEALRLAQELESGA